MLEILKLFPKEIKNEIIKNQLEGIEEIRIRVEKPIILKYSNQEIILRYKPKQEEILQILQFLCDNSIYSYQNQICNGYITISGGHRVGITGEVVIEKRRNKKHLIHI